MSGQNRSMTCRCCTSCMRRVRNNASVSAAQPQGAMLYHVAAFMEAVLIRSHRTPRCLRGALLRSELCAVGAAPPARMVYAGGPQRPAVFVSGVLHRLRPALQPHRQCGGGGVAAREQECCRGAPAAQPPADLSSRAHTEGGSWETGAHIGLQLVCEAADFLMPIVGQQRSVRKLLVEGDRERAAPRARRSVR